jgi:ubiquinone/menaquinone biosynthesis C-methylase UbiE
VVKLSDASEGLSGTALEQLGLEDESLGGYRRFWDEAASVDPIHAIADQDTPESFEVSGRREADIVWKALPRSDAVVLEIGCGLGRIMQHLAGSYREVHGIDISSKMVEQGARRLAHLENLHFHHGNGYDLEPFANESFDLVYSALVFQHMPKTIAYNYLLEAKRVLRPGGLLSFQVPNLVEDAQFLQFNHFVQPWFVQHPYPMYFWTPVEVVQLLTKAELWIEALDEKMQVLARKSEEAGPLALELQHSMGSELAGLTSSGRIAELERQLAERDQQLAQRTQRLADVEWQLQRFRSHPVIRVALATRRALRRDRR